MLASNNGYNAYKNNSINFASKEQLFLMLLDGAVKFSKIGSQAIADKEITKAHENIIKTQNIFYELMATLDTSSGEPWLNDLFNIYDFITRRLIDANLKKDTKIMDEIIPLIEDIRDTWNEAYRLSKSGK